MIPDKTAELPKGNGGPAITDLFKGLPVPDLFKQPWSFQALGSAEEREAISEIDELVEGEILDRGTTELLELQEALEDYRVDD